MCRQRARAWGGPAVRKHLRSGTAETGEWEVGAEMAVWKGPSGRQPACQSQDLRGHESHPRRCDGHAPPPDQPPQDCGRWA